MTISLAAATRSTPAGTVRFAVEDGGAVVALAYGDRWAALARRLDRRYGGAKLVSSREAAFVGYAIDAYLAGDHACLDALRVSPGGTDFQRRVWTALRAIPAGTTASYADLARAVGAPRAVRAVGAANGANPVSIIVPCHRVIGSDGALTGYGGGLDRKAWLLAHEARESPATSSRTTAGAARPPLSVALAAHPHPVAAE